MSKKPTQPASTDEDVWSELVAAADEPAPPAKRPFVRTTDPAYATSARSASTPPPPPAPVVPPVQSISVVDAILEGPDDGKIRYSCLIPVAAGGVLGAMGGFVMNAIAKQSRGKGAAQGAAFLATNAAVTCALLKAQDASMFDQNYNRVISFGAAGAAWPMAGQAWAAVKRAPMLPPAVGIKHSVQTAALCGFIGFIMDHWNIGRPTPMD